MLATPLSIFGGWQTVSKVARLAWSVLATAGIAASIASLAQPEVKWLALYYVTAIIVGYVAVAAGRAWERSRGAMFELSHFRLDQGVTLHLAENAIPIGVYDITVTNGDVATTICPRLASILDSTGKRLTEHSWDGHWRGQTPESFDGRFNEQDTSLYGLLALATMANGHPALFVYTTHQQPSIRIGDHGWVPIIGGMPLRDQKPITVTVGAYSVSDSGERGPPQTLVLTLSPNPTATNGVWYTPIIVSNSTAGALTDPELPAWLSRAREWVTKEWFGLKRRKSSASD